MNKAAPKLDPGIVTVKTLRRAVGIVGIGLPFAVALLARTLFHTPLQDSISSYYHTGARDLFVGALCATGVFLFCYKGYESIDNWVTNLAGALAIAVAFFPTAPTTTDCTVDPTAKIISILHFVFAAGFFLALSFLAFRLFTKSDQASLTMSKQTRNLVYRICAWTMVGALVLVGLFSLVNCNAPLITIYRPVFWSETLALVAFGFSWLVKGETLWRDRGAESETFDPQARMG
jgi:hypothetical protein